MQISTPTIRSSTNRLIKSTTQVRHATLIRRPKRPYTFTQLITLSDGSTFTHRTTSPAPIYRSTKDTKNNALWNPSSQKLMNIEEDEAGRLRKFRARFGRGFDVEQAEEAVDGEESGRNTRTGEQHDSLMDLIGGYGQEANAPKSTKGVLPSAESGGKTKAKGGKK